MDRDKELRAQQIFGEAIDCADADRPALIARACGDDAELRAEVESLVASIQEAAGFLASPTAGGAQELATIAFRHDPPRVEQAGTR